MANDSRVHAILNELLAAGRSSVLPRLPEAKAFARLDEAGDLAAVQHLVDEQKRDQQRLVETLIALGGEPRPAVGNIRTASFHYVDLHALLPRAVACCERLAEKHESAAKALADCPQAAEVVRDIAGRLRSYLEYLRKLAAA